MNASEKINGYTKEEAKNLVEYIWTGKKAGKTLTALFKSYGDEHGRARGSVRNYYYALMRNAKSDERVMKLLDGKDLAVEKIREFTEEETHETLKSILAEKSKGISVRRAILNIAGEDQKKMLRLQNKYRNVLKKQPEKIAQAEKELGIKTSGIKKTGAGNRAEKRAEELRGAAKTANDKNAPCNEFLKRRLEQEINALYERIAGALREENQRLRAENERLKRRLENRF
ncbi:MAG: hypothetical protein SPH68_04385 [Candidatus Borkfalkiaceae bacterium]|nr:hypothetical protein [Clostridia bacterium]MDY6223378.1 hypothetical protein [Christensenellaceae bacterium]